LRCSPWWEVTCLSCPTSPLCFSLVFLTGSDRIPIYGMSSLRIIIQSTTSGEQYLPVAHTCYNLLDLPKYSSKEILHARLVQAIDHYEGFSLA
ncbi:HERC3 ligase, partial [Sakesphorus luctuosus]|nr:HERC3 ligase [Sakesphorus luctuosus]